jgi:hypothetical protein
MKDNSLARLRRSQARLVMPLIGPLLDAFEAIPNDIVTMDELEDLCQIVVDIQKAMEGSE